MEPEDVKNKIKTGEFTLSKSGGKSGGTEPFLNKSWAVTAHASALSSALSAARCSPMTAKKPGTMTRHVTQARRGRKDDSQPSTSAPSIALLNRFL